MRKRTAALVAKDISEFLKSDFEGLGGFAITREVRRRAPCRLHHGLALSWSHAQPSAQGKANNSSCRRMPDAGPKTMTSSPTGLRIPFQSDAVVSPDLWLGLFSGYRRPGGSTIATTTTHQTAAQVSFSMVNELEPIGVPFGREWIQALLTKSMVMPASSPGEEVARAEQLGCSQRRCYEVRAL